MKFKTIMFIASLSMFNTSFALESSVSVTYNKPETFRDFTIEFAGSNKDRESLMKVLTKRISNSVTKKLKGTQYNMEFEFTNIDMAGHFLDEYNGRYFRTIRENDRAKLYFSYKLKDENGKVVKSEDMKLKSFVQDSIKSRNSKYKNNSFTYEMVMFDKWLNEFDFK